MNFPFINTFEDFKFWYNDLFRRAVDGTVKPLFVDYVNFRVGISTVIPTKAFHVSSTAQFEDDVIFNDVVSAANVTAARINITSTADFRSAINVTGSIQSTGDLNCLNITAGGLNITSTANFRSAINITGDLLTTGSVAGFRAVSYTWPTANGAAGTVLVNNGSGILSWSAESSGATITQPTRQVFLSGTGTYTTPTNVRQLKIRMVAGGGGGGGSEGGPTVGSVGGNTTFGVVTVVGGNGGSAQVASDPVNGGTGGSGGTGTASFRIPGGGGGGGSNIADVAGQAGGNSAFGGGGAARGEPSSNGIAGATNSGGGGSGAFRTTGSSAGSGGAGEYCEIIINNPSATYTFTVGAGGAGGSGTATGGAGAAGIIVVDETY